MVTTNDWFSDELFGKEWECYLNNQNEATQVIRLLDTFTASYQNSVPTFKQIMMDTSAPNEIKSETTQGVRQRLPQHSSNSMEESTYDSSQK